MKIYGKKDLSNYLKDDWILRMIKENELPEEASIRTAQWLVEMDNKRLIYSDMYGDLLTDSDKSRRILDVGGGYNSLTKVLAKNNDYFLIDFFAHSTGGGGYSLHAKYKVHVG